MNDDEINLHEVWQKLVAYKKTYWAIFCSVFLILATIAFTLSKQYKFVQLFEVGKYSNSNLTESPLFENKELTVGVRTLCLGQALNEYNTKNDKKISIDAYKSKILINYIGNRLYSLEARDKLDHSGVYRFVFKEVINKIIDSKAIDINQHIKNMQNRKKTLENRLYEFNNFYNLIISNLREDKQNENNNNKLDVKSVIVRMYVKDLQAMAINLDDTIYSTQAQIDGTCNTKAVGNFIVEDLTRISKLARLILVFMLSLLLAFLSVLVIDFLKNFKK